MNITKKLTDNELVISLSGRLDTASAPQLQETINTCKEDFQNLVFDFTDLDYISSAGLRVLLLSNKIMTANGKNPITIRNANEIAVVIDGQIKERGTHDQLIAENGTYKKLYSLQFRENDLFE